MEAHRKNPKVQPLVVHSGPSGTLKDALYYSWPALKQGDEGRYQSGGVYGIDNIQGKRFSWVSTSSTSGFKVPSSDILGYFSKRPKWANLTADMLLEGGPDKFFEEILFGNSRRGSAVNLRTGKADVSAFCDTCVANYVEFVSGTENRPGAVYQVRKDAAAAVRVAPPFFRNIPAGAGGIGFDLFMASSFYFNLHEVGLYHLANPGVCPYIGVFLEQIEEPFHHTQLGGFL